MNNEVHYGCDLFVNASVSEAVLAAELAQLLGSEPEDNYVHTTEGFLCVLKNKEFDAEMRHDPIDGFLYYRLRLEVEPTAELGKENAVEFVSRLLEYLWSRDYPAVAACNYEDELPHKGGYKSVYTPSIQSEEQTIS